MGPGAAGAHRRRPALSAPPGLRRELGLRSLAAIVFFNVSGGLYGVEDIHPRFGTPWVAVVVSAAIHAAFATFSFKELIVLDVWRYSLAALVELAAFVRLRVRVPEMPRPWCVPGRLGVAAVGAGLPAALALLAMGRPAGSTPSGARWPR